jgi:hypothetical protein
VTTLCLKIRDEPSLAKRIYSLYHGADDIDVKVNIIFLYL